MKKTNQRLLYLLPLLLGVALIVFGEALSDLWKEDIKALFQQNKWLLLAFVLLIALVGYLWERQQRSEKTAPEAVDKDQYEEAFGKFKELLKEQYQIRLNSKTGRRLPVNLTAKSTHFGMTPERVEAYFKDKELTIESENIASEIDKILKANDRLLLIGDPGAGKTTILLYAAINILNDAGEPKLPLILNLATWSEGRDFAEWYAQNIAHTYSLSPVFVRELLRCNAVVPFFDGFDEVAEKYRDDCFQKMAAYFGDRRERQLIVSSRKKEYAAAEADAPVYAEIEVQPLSLAQIKRSLSENAQSQAADRALLHAIEKDKWLAETVETPFYLNTASFLFGKGQRTLADFPFKAKSTKGRKTELVEIFVAEQVPEEWDRKYLSFLAEKMNVENFLVFELIKIRPGWCRGSWWYRLFGVSTNSKILTNDIEVWRWPKFIKYWRSGRILRNAVKTSLEFGLYGAIIGVFISNFVSGLVGGLIGGLVMSLVADLKYGGIMINYFLHIPSPYERFWADCRNSFWVALAIPLALIAGFWTAAFWEQAPSWEKLKDWIQDSDLGLICLFLILIFFIIPLFVSQFPFHFSLRLVLYLEGKMPLRVVAFMDRMSEQLIFEDNRRSDKKGKKRRGATWRFRHKILQDYFAGNPA